MKPWLASFEITFPASNVDELLLALVVRDLVYGSSYDVESEETGEKFQVDITASDELDGGSYQLFVEAEVTGTENRDLAAEFLEQVFEEAVDEGEALVEARQNLAVRNHDEIEYRAVAEDDERWDLVIPDWLAPEGAEVPFGFRAFAKATGEAVPSDDDLDGSGRVVLVPVKHEVHIISIPAPETEEGCAGNGAD